MATPGGKLWRWKYRFDGKEKRLALGRYSETSLKDARIRRDEARAMLAQGIDPASARKAEKAAHVAQADTVERVAREWFERNREKWTPNHAATILRRLERDVFPWLGATPIANVKPATVLDGLRCIEGRSVVETTHRIKSLIGQIMRYAVSTGRAENDPTPALRGALPPMKTTHHQGPHHTGRRGGDFARLLRLSWHTAGRGGASTRAHAVRAPR